MAEALWNDLGEGQWRAWSAGSDPAGYVHPLAVKAMGELGIDLSEHESKSLQGFVDEPFDLVVTVCGNAREACPAFPAATQMLHWPFDDPAHARGTEDERLAEFRHVRDQIRERISSYLSGEK